MSAQLNQLAFSFAIPANVIRHPVANTKPITQSVARAAIESSMGESRLLCEQWAKSAEAGTLEAWGVTWEFIELREKHSESEIRAEYALLRSIVADRYRSIKNALYPVKPRYVNPHDPSVTWSGRGRRPAWFEECLSSGMTIDQLEIGGGE